MNKDQKISIGQINFINCLPINYSFYMWHLERIILSDGYPAFINQLMRGKQVHIAPVSSIEYLQNIDKYTLMDNICISSDGEVKSVILFSNSELKELNGKRIAVPYTSATSTVLLKVLLDENGVDINNCQFITHKYNSPIEKTLSDEYDAILYIGDPALEANFKYIDDFRKYDLGEEWKKITNYPMVFGTWVAGSDWKTAFEDDFAWINFLLDKAVDTGLNMYFNDVINFAAENVKVDREYIEDYLTVKIKYKFTQKHRESLELFHNKCFRLKIINNDPIYSNGARS